MPSGGRLRRGAQARDEAAAHPGDGAQVAPPPQGQDRPQGASSSSSSTKKSSFAPGSANLDPASEPILEDLRKFLDHDKAITKVRIEGHTDSPQNTPDMMALSKARSRAVSEWLANHGIAPNRVLPVGCGSSRPIKDKGGAVDHARTKRTELHVIEEKGAPVGGPPPGDCAAD